MHANGITYRYYLSSALLDGRPTKAGSVSRVPAVEIETLVIKSVREHLKLEEPTDDSGIINSHVIRVEIQADQLVVQVALKQESKRGRPSAGNSLHIPWHKTLSVRRREIL